MNPNASDFTKQLRGFRAMRRLSQLELSLQLGVSQRHVSFVESGRSRPSRALLVSWLQALQVPLIQSNETLVKAGCAPEYPATEIDEPGLASAQLALASLLEAHDPVPAFVLDDCWNIHALNRGAGWLAQTLIPSLLARSDQSKLNMLDLFADPEGLGGLILNLDDVGPRFLALLENEALSQAALTPRVNAFKAMLRDSKAGVFRPDTAIRVAPALTTVFASQYGELAFMSMFTTFGTPQDITLASLRVEHLFPADGFTRTVLFEHVAST